MRADVAKKLGEVKASLTELLELANEDEMDAISAELAEVVDAYAGNGGSDDDEEEIDEEDDFEEEDDFDDDEEDEEGE